KWSGIMANDVAMCHDAAPGRYVPDDDHSAAIMCTAGTYQPSPGQNSCLQATAGHFAPVAGASQVFECMAGSYAPDAGSASCTPASPGHYVPSIAATEQLACVSGSWSGMSATSCMPATPGHYVSDADRGLMNPCQRGTYQPLGGQNTCLVAPVNTYVQVIGSAEYMNCPTGTISAARSTSASSCYVPNTTTVKACKLKIGKNPSVACVAATVGFKVVRGTTITMSLPSRAQKTCVIKSRKVLGKAKGTCNVNLAITFAGSTINRSTRVTVIR
ncbi:MAG: hypothetical protein RL683_439, partial [Actinomycetota bacterium]